MFEKWRWIFFESQEKRFFPAAYDSRVFTESTDTVLTLYPGQFRTFFDLHTDTLLKTTRKVRHNNQNLPLVQWFPCAWFDELSPNSLVQFAFRCKTEQFHMIRTIPVT